MRNANRNTFWAGVLVDELARAGVGSWCACPGSRSTPIVLAAADHSGIHVFTHVDERAAGFFALGLAKATGRPAAVVSTSGTAAANLVPAVVEAAQSQTPMLVLTADRPPRLRGGDANQTIDQRGLFGSYVRDAIDLGLPEMTDEALRGLRGAVARATMRARSAPQGPVHINLPFAKPLEPTVVPDDVPPGLIERFPLGALGRPGDRPFTRTVRGRVPPTTGEIERLANLVSRTERGLIVAGPVPDPVRTGRAILRLAERTGYPLLADSLSGARFGPGACRWALTRYDAYLRDPAIRDGVAPELVLRFGSSPVSTAVGDLLLRHADAYGIVIDAGWRWADHRASATEYHLADPGLFATALGDGITPLAPSPWSRLWGRLDAAAAGAMKAASTQEPFEATCIARLAAALPAGSQLFIGNSMPIRDLDGYAGPRDEPVGVTANRGASGIDGAVSTALGVSAATGRPTVAILGDLTFLHDLTGLFATREDGVAVVFVVLNNDGGGIFDQLPVRDFEPAFTRHIVVPHGLDLRHAAALYGLPYERLAASDDPVPAVERALATARTAIIEIRTERDHNRRARAAALAAACGAARTVLTGDPA
ncbi:MAG TPA: 2-succinyl-5-enolpyruvyl-6-hydroxy-3-cyclohexene-1-carboxylic-acid synthase [Gemmatimonadales bacterium]